VRLPNDTLFRSPQSKPRAGLIPLPEEGRIAILRIHSVISSALDLAVRYDWGVQARDVGAQSSARWCSEVVR
jgi:hypothetical protein